MGSSGAGGVQQVQGMPGQMSWMGASGNMNGNGNGKKAVEGVDVMPVREKRAETWLVQVCVNKMFCCVSSMSCCRQLQLAVVFAP
jgi:hypothetical protein